MAAGSPNSIAIEPLTGPIDKRVRVPGSKSYTNRVLPVAALARGRTEIYGALFSDDTRHMIEALRALEIRIETDEEREDIFVSGCGGHLPVQEADIFVGNAGTAARFLPPLLAAGRGEFRVDGVARMRERPMAPLVDALNSLGGDVVGTGPEASVPLTITANGLDGGTVIIDGSQSSQFISGLLLAGPFMRRGLEVEVRGELVSRPYVDMTCRVMHDFGVEVESDRYRRFAVRGGHRYMGHTYQVEPDASAAAYFFAAAVICGGSVSVRGLGAASLQGDLGFVRVLEQMGAQVRVRSGETIVSASTELHGIEADLADLSDTVPTLAVVAAFADSPTRISGVGFIRKKESDRIGDVVRELTRIGVDATEDEDGMTIRPGPPQGARIETYDDHRIAMAFALVGLRVAGIEISDPGCVAKTLPGYFEVLAGLGGG